MQSTIEALLGTENAARKLAEQKIEEIYAVNPLELIENLVGCLGGSQGVATMSCVLLKKYYLDKRAKC